VSAGAAAAREPAPLEAFRRRAEAFLAERTLAYHEALAGLREDAGLEAVYGRYPEIGDPAAVRRVRAALETGAPGEREERRLRQLLAFTATAVEERAGREAEEASLSAEARAVVRADGEEVPFRALRVRLRNAGSRELRRALWDGGLEVTRELQPHLRRVIETAHEAARSLGAADYVSWRAGLAGFDPGFLLEQTALVLDETAAPYADLLDWFARRELGLRARDLRGWDLPRLLRGGAHDEHFPPGEMVACVGACVRAMGLDPLAEGRIQLDLEPRPLKSSRAFCSPIRVPHDVRLVVLPSGGADDWRAYLHELGHALHFAYAAPAAPFEERCLGDDSVTETYAALFDHWLLLPRWLRHARGLADPRDVLLLGTFEELYLLRRYAAKLRYELALHARGPDPALAERYAEELSRATGVPAPPERWLEDVDPRFYCVSYLQAWMLCGLLRRALRERFDEDWFRNPRAGPFLAGLFARGQRDTPSELAALLDAGPLGFAELLAWVREGLEGRT
jgi:hypothetical protein